MPEDFGKAFKDLISQKELPSFSWKRMEGRSVFMNDKRRRAFEYITEMPAPSYREMERALQSSVPAIKWHMDRFSAVDLITVDSYKNMNIIYPNGYVSEREARILSSLRNPVFRQGLEIITRKPGISAHALTEEVGTYPQRMHTFCKEMLLLGVVHSEKIGKERRYFPSDDFISMIEAGPRTDYLMWFAKWLESDLLEPEEVEERNGYGEIEFSLPGRNKGLLRINLLPYRNLFQKKRKDGKN